MLTIAGRTAAPSWLKFFEGTHGYTGGDKGKKKFFFKIKIFFVFNGQRRAIQLVFYILH